MAEFAHYFDSVVDTIGHTPVVPLRRLAGDLPATVLVKLESRNPGGSVKDRIGLAMIKDAEERGLLTPGESVIVEPTSGNTGIALALVGAERGYRVILTMPESMSIERRKLLAAYGAELVLTPREKGMRGSVEEAERVAAEIPGAWIAGQFDNPANPAIHYATTGPEVHGAVGDRTLGAFVAGVGTGGTITGAAATSRNIAPAPAPSRSSPPSRRSSRSAGWGGPDPRAPPHPGNRRQLHPDGPRRGPARRGDHYRC
jgi:cysteine synthase